MTQSIKLSTEQMLLMSTFEKTVHAPAKDCVYDEKLNRMIFVVNTGDMSRAIGKGGANIKALQQRLKKSVELVEYNEDPAKFIRGALNQKLVSDVEVSEREDGLMQALVSVPADKKGLVIGRAGCHIEKAKLLARRYFGIEKITINAPQRTMLEM